MNEQYITYGSNFVRGLVGLEYTGNYPIKDGQDRSQFVPYAGGLLAKILIGGGVAVGGASYDDPSFAQVLIGIGLVGDALLTPQRAFKSNFTKQPAGLVGRVLNTLQKNSQ